MDFTCYLLGAELIYNEKDKELRILASPFVVIDDLLLSDDLAVVDVVRCPCSYRCCFSQMLLSMNL